MALWVPIRMPVQLKFFSLIDAPQNRFRSTLSLHKWGSLIFALLLPISPFFCFPAQFVKSFFHLVHFN
jgi:hypothetical protein